MTSLYKLPLLLTLLSFMSPAFSETALYDTGPSEESAYLRFINASAKNISVKSSSGSATITLNAQENSRVSAFYRIKAGETMTAYIHGNGRKIPVHVTGKPWEYITVATVPDNATDIKVMLIKEAPEDFNAMRASLALFNLDPTCKLADMRSGDKNLSILKDVEPFNVKRRLVNPVRLNVTIGCGEETDSHLELPQLQAGERYSAFLFSSGIKPLVEMDKK